MAKRKAKPSTTPNKKGRARSTAKVDSLKKALQTVETLRKPLSFQRARDALEKVLDFPPAVVLLASKLSTQTLESFDFMEIGDTAEEKEEFTALEHLCQRNAQRCCRGQAMGKHMTSSAILNVGRPVMTKHPKPKKLSEISEVLEIILCYTQVVLQDEDRQDWDAYESWLETYAYKIPLFLDITDPAFLFIRGANGGPPPPGIAKVLNTLPIAAGGTDGRLTAAPVFPIRRPPPAPVGGVAPPVQAPIPNLYQFANRQDAGIARAALIVWAATTVAGNLDFLRMIAPQGVVWD